VRLFDVLALCNARLPQAALTLTSNASALTGARLSRLATVRNLAYLWISFNDHRPDVYEQVMRLPYRRTIERLSMLHRRKAAGEFGARVVVSRVGDGTSDDAAFAAWVRREFPLFDVSVFRRGSWLGQVDTAVGAVPAVGCARWFELSITATGTVAHCCMDGQADWPIGDVRTAHVLDVYNQPAYRALRERAVSRLDASPCRQCTLLSRSGRPDDRRARSPGNDVVAAPEADLAGPDVVPHPDDRRGHRKEAGPAEVVPERQLHAGRQPSRRGRLPARQELLEGLADADDLTRHVRQPGQARGPEPDGHDIAHDTDREPPPGSVIAGLPGLVVAIEVADDGRAEDLDGRRGDREKNDRERRDEPACTHRGHG
jgi:hypothetical protein